MAQFDTNHVRNIALLGHAGSGKTTLAECMLFEAGLTERIGSVAEKSTVSDYHELEKERGNSIFMSLLHTKWKDYKINIIDTPGYDDFAGEVISALRVADCGVLLLNAAHGVEVGTQMIWEYTEEFQTPMILAINHVDNEKSDFEATLAQAKERFGSKVIQVQYPLNQGAGFNAIIDVLQMTMYEFGPQGGKPAKKPIPADEKEKADRLHNELVEAIAANDNTLMEKYFEKGTLEEDEMRQGLKLSLMKHDIFPVFCLSAGKNMGSGRIMGFIDVAAPGAHEMPPQKLKSGGELKCDPKGPACIFVFKSQFEHHLGEISFFKVYSGEVKAGMELVNEANQVTEKINQLFIAEGKKRINVDSLVAGDIGATIKLKNTHTNNTLHIKGANLELEPIKFPLPSYRMAIEPAKRGEEEKLSIGLHQLQEEDPTIIVDISPELKQTIINCQGELHLAVIKWKLEHEMGIEVHWTDPKIPYRETIRKKVQTNYRHKKQSGGAGQFGEVHMEIEPWYEGLPDPTAYSVRGKELVELEWGGKLEFINCIVGGAIELRFMASILKGVMDKMHEGPVTGSPVRDIRVTVYDGKMHAVDSNDMAFRLAGMMAFKNGFHEANPLVLEPVYSLEVTCPGEYMGDVMGELQTRRAIIEGMDSQGTYQKIMAKAPLIELQTFSPALRSITQGRGKFKMRFAEFIPVPPDVQKKLADAYHAQTAESGGH